MLGRLTRCSRRELLPMLGRLTTLFPTFALLPMPGRLTRCCRRSVVADAGPVDRGVAGVVADAGPVDRGVPGVVACCRALPCAGTGRRLTWAGPVSACPGRDRRLGRSAPERAGLAAGPAGACGRAAGGTGAVAAGAGALNEGVRLNEGLAPPAAPPLPAPPPAVRPPAAPERCHATEGRGEKASPRRSSWSSLLGPPWLGWLGGEGGPSEAAAASGRG